MAELKTEKQWSKEDRAKAILECVTLGDVATCEKYSISLRTLQRWHRAFKYGSDAELSQSVANKKAAMDKEWASKIPDALSAGLDYLKRAAEDASTTDAEAIHAVAGAVKIISEVDGTYRMIDARIRGQAGAVHPANGPVPAGSNVTPIRKSG